jgi:hypothetical protein
MTYNGRVEEIGDMELSYGHQEIEASNLSLEPGKVKLLLKTEWDSLSRDAEFELLKEGYLYAKCTDDQSLNDVVSGRILHLTNRDESPVQAAGIGQQAQFILFQDSKPRYAIIKGFVIDLTKELQELSFPE